MMKPKKGRQTIGWALLLALLCARYLIEGIRVGGPAGWDG